MYKKIAIIQMALPLAITNILICLFRSNEITRTLLILLPTLIAFFTGHFTAKRQYASWKELSIGFLLAHAHILAFAPSLTIFIFHLSSAGFFLLPLLSSAVTIADKATFISKRKAISYAFSFVTIFLLIGSRDLPFLETIFWAFSTINYLFLPTISIAILLSISQRFSRAGAWVGSVSTAALWISFLLCFLVLPFLPSLG